MPYFKSVNELEIYVNGILLQAMDLVADKLLEILKEHIAKFYSEYGNPEPIIYPRSMDLLKLAPIKIEPIIVGNTVTCGVEIEPNNLRQTPWSNKGYSGIRHEDREEVIKSTMQGFHGSVQTDERFLEFAIREVLQDKVHIQVLTDMLRKNGIEVTVR